MTVASMYQCRPLCPDDWQAFQALRLKSIEDAPLALYPTYEEEASQVPEAIPGRIAETPSQVVFGVFDGGVLAGIAGLRRNPLVQVAHKGVLWGVFVHPDRRRDGLARQLLCELFTYAHARGVTQVHLSVNVENARAGNLYRSMGFEVYGREPGAMRVGGTFYDEELMVLRLDS